MINGRTFRSSSNQGGAPLKVTALWGWTAVPAPVKQACKIMAAETFQMKDAPLGVAGADSFGTVMRVKDNPGSVQQVGPVHT